MSDEDVKDAAEAAAEKVIEARHGLERWAPIVLNLGVGFVALTASVVNAKLSFEKFRVVYEDTKGVTA